MVRDLRADEIECRVAQAKETGVSLLLYKDARCDQNILDETVGSMNWMRHHCRDNANCVVSIWDEQKKMWVEKEDTGTESNTEKEKGLASDSFKRACFNWGIGRELYTAPFIWVNPSGCTDLKKSDRGIWRCADRFEVSSISIQNKRITALTIINAKNKAVVFRMGAHEQNENPPRPAKAETRPPAEGDAPIYCEECTLRIPDYFDKNRLIKAAEAAERSIEMYGRCLCATCAKKVQR